MGSFTVRRLLQFVPTLFLVSVIVFLMVRAIPGNVAYVLLGPNATQDQVVAVQKQLGLNRPLWDQYGIWLSGILHGNFGQSWINDYPVSSLIRSKFPATAALAIGSLLVALLISFPIGIAAALREGTWVDRVALFYTSLGLGVPTFWLGILLVLAFSLRLKWLPPSGYVPITQEPLASLKMLILPSFTLGIYLSAIFARFLRSSILAVIQQDYVRTAAAKGLPARTVIARHVLKNALIPVVTMLGLQFGGLLGGAVIVEAIFDWPGLGRLLVTSIASRDYAVVQGTILLAAVAYLVVNLITDLTYGFLDPRIRAH